MHGERDHEAKLGKLHGRVARDREERIERLGAAERKPEREEMQRQENRERHPRNPVHHGGRKARLSVRGADHARNTASAARRPRTMSRTPKRPSATSSERPRHAVHSRSTLRSPIGACTATASTKTE